MTGLMNVVLRQRKALGIIFLALVVLAVYMTYATFTKKFADYDEVTVKTSKIGLQLPSRADVKIRGVLVGEVLATDTTADGAELTLGLFPSQVDTIPANVTALDRAQDAVRREVRLPDHPRRARRRSRSRPAPPSSAPRSPPRSRRCSPTSTRCCARSSPPSST